LIATASQITRLVDALMPQAVDETALPALSILLQLVMGTSSEDLHKLPVWPSTEIKLPALALDLPMTTDLKECQWYLAASSWGVSTTLCRGCPQPSA
jgi:hypothetical protein